MTEGNWRSHQPYHASAPPEPGGAPAYGPPTPARPRSSRSRLVIFAAITSLVVASVVTGLLLRDGDDQAAGSGNEAVESAQSVPMIEGDGYSYPLPDGWEDISDDEAAPALPGHFTTDTVAILGEHPDAPLAHITVETRPASAITDLEQLRPSWEKALKDQDTLAKAAEQADGTEIDGEPALGAIVRYPPGYEGVVRMAFLTLHEGRAYSVVFATTTASPTASTEDEVREMFELILDGWSWQNS